MVSHCAGGLTLSNGLTLCRWSLPVQVVPWGRNAPGFETNAPNELGVKTSLDSVNSHTELNEELLLEKTTFEEQRGFKLAAT